MLESALMLCGVFAIAFVFAPVGMGGGMLFAPLLHYGAGWPIDETLLAVSLCLTWSVSVGSGLRHRREGHYDDDATKSAIYGAVLGALIGVGIVNALGDGLDTVFKLISIVMLAWALLKTKRKLERIDEEEEAKEAKTRAINHFPLRAGAGIGGALSSVLGIGAGVIYVPVLQQNTGLDARSSIGSSLTIMMTVVPVAILTLLFTSATGIAGTFQGQPWWFYILPFIAYGGATSGAQFGIEHISTKNIMNVFMALIAVVLIRYLLDVFRLIA